MTRAVWVFQGGFPVGARITGDDPGQLGPAGPGRVWLNVCSVGGQHLPQMYAETELSDLTEAGCPVLGLCPGCLGFGTPGPLPAPDWYPYGVDEIPAPCQACAGSGRIGLRSAVARSPGQVEGRLSFVPHGYVEPVRGAFQGVCLGCGNPPGHESHQERS